MLEGKINYSWMKITKLANSCKIKNPNNYIKVLDTAIILEHQEFPLTIKSNPEIPTACSINIRLNIDFPNLRHPVKIEQQFVPSFFFFGRIIYPINKNINSDLKSKIPLLYTTN